jgi:hypothetical protein
MIFKLHQEIAMRRGRWAVFAVCAGALWLASPRANAGFIDPTGDVFNSGFGFQPDITTYSATFTGSSTTFTVNFASAIAPASSFAANSLFGFIDIDQDKNAATGGNAAWGANQPGGNSWINFFVANGGIPAPYNVQINLGDEFFVDLSTEANHPGTVDVFNAATNASLFTVPIAFTPTSYSLTVPFVGTGDGSMNFGLLVGNANVVTDRAPNGAVADTTQPLGGPAVPEPTSLALLAQAALIGLVGCHIRRRGGRFTKRGI